MFLQCKAKIPSYSNGIRGGIERDLRFDWWIAKKFKISSTIIQTAERELYTYFSVSHGGLSYNSVTTIAKNKTKSYFSYIAFTVIFLQEFRLMKCSSCGILPISMEDSILTIKDWQ